MNPENSKDSYILLEKIDNDRGVVKDSGKFNQKHINELLNIYKIKEKHIPHISHAIFNLTSLINDWIRKTGGVFIFNQREIE